ncbi:MAG TPA: tandem-95 repeat protein [Candidatus Thermoplasmatota archaeon]
MARHSHLQAIALAIALSVGVPLLPATVGEGATPAASASSPAPAVAPPFAVPFLEAAQVKVEIGSEAPLGPAMSFVGAQNAWVNFSVWWWDTGPATSANVFVDGVQYAMSEVPGQDGVYENGTLYRAIVNATDLGPGVHSWSYSFTGPSGPLQLPTSGAMGELVLDRAEMFLDQALVVAATQTLASAYASGTLADLREVVVQAASLLDAQMSSHWNGSDVPYDYVDMNHNITGPIALAVSGQEVFVAHNGLQRTGFGDSGLVPGNSQPAHKQALALRGLLLACGLFNESDLVIMSDVIDVNGTPHYHPYLRVALNDGSEQAGDGTADNDSLIDVDLWGGGLPSPVDLGAHFGDEDNDTSDDVPWPHPTGWPPTNDSQARLVLWPRASTLAVTTPAGASLTFHVVLSTIDAQATVPYALQAYWKDEPIVFDALASTQTMFLDMRFTWSVTGQGINGAGPVWAWYAPPQILGLYTVVLTAVDVYGDQDSITISFLVRAKTELRQPVPNGSFLEDSRLPFDLRGYFGDEDGFSTITFDIRTTPDEIMVERSPPTAPNLSFVAAPDWCGPGSVTINATDGASPVVSATFALTVACVNDPPVLAGLPDLITFPEGGEFVLGNLSLLARDVDGDVIAWSLLSSNILMWEDTLNDSLVFRPRDPEWSGSDGTTLSASDATVSAYWSITFIVTPVNDAPRATTPIPGFTVDEDIENVTIALTDHFTDPDGDVLSAEVTAEPGLVAGYFAPQGVVWFHPTANYSGPTGFTIRVRDAANASVSVRVDVQVTPVNDAPRVIDFEPKGYVTGTEGDLIIFVVQVVDSDSPILTYTYHIDGDPFSSGTTPTFEWQTGFASSGRHEVEVVVTDSAGGEARHAWQVQLENDNRAPMVEIRLPGGSSYDAGENIQLVADGSDPDGEPLVYSWTFGGVIQPMSGQVINISFSSAGNHTVRVTVTDGEATASASVVINVVYTPPLSPPPPPPPNGTDEPTPFLPAPVAALAVVAVGVAMALIARRRREG